MQTDPLVARQRNTPTALTLVGIAGLCMISLMALSFALHRGGAILLWLPTGGIVFAVVEMLRSLSGRSVLRERRRRQSVDWTFTEQHP